MNYHHIFHAGNLCDVAKHVALTLALALLKNKDKGFAVLDTHAGVGLYDLDDPRAKKTGEADEGIKRLLETPARPEIADYFAVLKKMNPLWDGKGREGFRVYPGSPLFIFHSLREQDRLIACELNPDEAEALRAHAPADARIQVHFRDGYEALSAFLPPPEKRGLVLIDPPYEKPDEFETLAKNIAKAYKKWPTGIYMIWYPVKDLPAIWKFCETLAGIGIPKILKAEFVYDEDARADRLTGSGLIVINPPWGFAEKLKTVFSLLHKAMQTNFQGNEVLWIGNDASLPYNTDPRSQ